MVRAEITLGACARTLRHGTHCGNIGDVRDAHSAQQIASGRLADGPVPLAEAVEFLRDIAMALEYVCRAVPRDVKPENVLLNGSTVTMTGLGITPRV